MAEGGDHYMSWDLRLRKNLSEANRMTKSFAAGVDKEFSGNFRGEMSLLNPVFVVETTDDLTQYNYCEITAFNRKYFATIRAVGYKLWEISCNVDVISTYANGIKASKALVRRTQKTEKIDFYINDGTFYTEQRSIVTYHTFKRGGDDATLGTESYYLLVAGG